MEDLILYFSVINVIGLILLIFRLNKASLKTKRKADQIKVGQVYELKVYADDPFERGKHAITILDIREGYALYKFDGKYTSSDDLESIARRYVLIKDIEENK